MHGCNFILHIVNIHTYNTDKHPPGQLINRSINFLYTSFHFQSFLFAHYTEYNLNYNVSQNKHYWSAKRNNVTVTLASITFSVLIFTTKCTTGGHSLYILLVLTTKWTLSNYSRRKHTQRVKVAICCLFW